MELINTRFFFLFTAYNVLHKFVMFYKKNITKIRKFFKNLNIEKWGVLTVERFYLCPNSA